MNRIAPPLNDDQAKELKKRVVAAVDGAAVYDMHTHLFAPQFGALNLWGADELLTYHYIIAEFFRSSALRYEEFWKLPKSAQSDLIWETLFVHASPVSEATLGVVSVLSALGLDPRARDLREIRSYFASVDPDEHLNRILDISGVSDVVMTNDPLNAAEAAMWEQCQQIDSRFRASLRLDTLLLSWTQAVPMLKARGYEVAEEIDTRTRSELTRFFKEWIEQTEPVYCGVSLPSDFRYPDPSACETLLTKVVFPVCREHSLPVSLMIGPRRQVNPSLRLAGDALGRADLSSLINLCTDFPENRFLVSLLSRENQHELCVIARKFRNLMPFGCWWFLNISSIIPEITRERFELLGLSFIPQHSDARVLDQLVYKWGQSRRDIANALYTSYEQLAQHGWQVSDAEIARDVEQLFSGNFLRFAQQRPRECAQGQKAS